MLCPSTQLPLRRNYLEQKWSQEDTWYKPCSKQGNSKMYLTNATFWNKPPQKGNTLDPKERGEWDTPTPVISFHVHFVAVTSNMSFPGWRGSFSLTSLTFFQRSLDVQLRPECWIHSECWDTGGNPKMMVLGILAALQALQHSGTSLTWQAFVCGPSKISNQPLSKGDYQIQSWGKRENNAFSMRALTWLLSLVNYCK